MTEAPPGDVCDQNIEFFKFDSCVDMIDGVYDLCYSWPPGSDPDASRFTSLELCRHFWSLKLLKKTNAMKYFT